jgi:hypothetical protein
MYCKHVRKRIQGTEPDGSIHVRNEDSFVVHTWMEGNGVCLGPDASAIAKLTQCQAITHQVGSPNVVHGLGSRTENERPVAGSDICREVKKDCYILRTLPTPKSPHFERRFCKVIRKLSS